MILSHESYKRFRCLPNGSNFEVSSVAMSARGSERWRRSESWQRFELSAGVDFNGPS